jgi:hypothetical protein
MFPRKGPKTDILTSIVFQKISTIEFDFAAISVMVCDEALLRCLLRFGGEWYKFLSLYTSTLLLDRVSQQLDLSPLIISTNRK